MPSFVFENGPRVGDAVRLENGSLVLGRSANCTLKVPDEHVEERHAQIKEHKGRFFIKDLGSTSGTRVNTKPVSTAELRDGDVLEVGSTRLAFQLTANASPKATPKPKPASPPPKRPAPQSASPKGDRLVGKEVGGYRIEERLGRGGMGTVYRATQLSLDREVALKVLSPNLIKDPAFIEQFVREARAAGRLTHGHIVQVYDVGHEGNLYFYAMEYVRSGSVADLQADQGALSVPDAVRIVTEAARALEYAELKHIVHRDIKPDNLMLTEQGHVKVADLGLARSLQESAAKEPEGILGTPHFISPEQARRQDLDIRSDIYSLGATFYLLLTGQTPFQGENAKDIIRKQVREEPTAVRDVRPDVPEKVAQLVERMMQKDREERPQNAAELLSELEAVTEHSKKTTLILVPALLVIIAVVAFFLLRDDEAEPTTIIKEVTTGIEESDLEREKSRAEQLAFELEAREAFAELPADAPRDARLFDLRRFTESYKDTSAATDAQAEIDRLESDIAEETRLAELREAAIVARLAALQKSVDDALTAGEFLAAIRATLSVAEDASLDEAPRIVDLKASLTTKINDAATTQGDALIQKAQTARDSGDYDNALKWAEEAKALGDAGENPPPPESLAVLKGIADRADSLLSDVRNRVDERLHAQRRAELTAVASAVMDPSFRNAILDFEFGTARATLDAKTQATTDAHLRVYADHWLLALDRGQALHKKLIDAVRSGTLTNLKLKPPGETREGTITGLAENDAGLRVDHRLAAGVVGKSLAWRLFASVNGMRLLYEDRLTLSDEDRLGLASMGLVMEEARFLDSLTPLIQALQSYDPETGWAQSQRSQAAQTKVQKPAFEPCRNLAVNLPADDLLGRLDREEAAVELLLTGLAPFLDPEVKGAAFLEAEAILTRFASEHRDTLLMGLVYGILDGGRFDLPLASAGE